MKQQLEHFFKAPLSMQLITSNKILHRTWHSTTTITMSCFIKQLGFSKPGGNLSMCDLGLSFKYLLCIKPLP